MRVLGTRSGFLEKQKMLLLSLSHHSTVYAEPLPQTRLHVEGEKEDETLGFLNQVTLCDGNYPQQYDKPRKSENIHVLKSMC